MQTALALPVPAPVPSPLAPPPRSSKVLPTKPTRAKAAVAGAAASVASPAPIILFGPDANGRPHGARFVESNSAAVERAADLMDYYLVVADTEALRELAAKLPAGRLFPASGKAFVPFISGALNDQLLVATGNPVAPKPARAAGKAAEAGAGSGAGDGRGAGGSGAGDPPSRVGAKAPSNHADIGIGSTVLAQGDDEDDEGYYAAKVMLTKADDQFVLTWADYPDLPQITRSRRALALLHPEAAAKLA